MVRGDTDKVSDIWCIGSCENWSSDDECFGSFSTYTARFLLNDCEGLIFCTIFADDGEDKS